MTSPSDNLLERVAMGLLHVRFSTTDERIAEWRASNGSVWKGAMRDARAAIDAMAEASNDLVAEMDPTQRGDEIAAEMRAYFEANKHQRYVEGTADNLMIGLMNIAVSRMRDARGGGGR